MRPTVFVEPMQFRRAPLAAVAVWFAAGIALSRWQATKLVAVPVAAVLAGLILLALIAGFALARRERLAWLPVAAIWMVLGLAAGEWQPSPAYPTALMG